MRLYASGAAAVVIMFIMAGGAFAAKPAQVVDWSNGFPSGEHFNLNIHGKKDGFSCDGSPGGGSLFVPEYGSAEIQSIQNKKSSISNLTIHDACGGFDGDAAEVELPSGEYQVYARILAKPMKADESREVVFYPRLVEACDDSGTQNFTDATSCDESFLLGTGVVTKDGAFDTDSQKLERTKGKSKAVDISSMFQWSGYACDQSVDLDGDGEITLADASDLDGDGDVDEDDLALLLEQLCTLHESTWIYDIADLVVHGWDYQNNGAKLLQIRFYPTDSTSFA